MDVTGQLTNLSATLEELLILPSLPVSDRPRLEDQRRYPAFRVRHYELVRDALVHELTAAGCELRLVEIRRLVEERLGRPVDRHRFRDYVNDQSRAQTRCWSGSVGVCTAYAPE